MRALLAVHLRFSHDVTPAGHVHALDVDGLRDPAVAFFSARRGGELLGVGALKHLDDTHGELKSMHTAAAARGQGVGRAMVEHLLAVARGRGYRRVSLETGTMDEFAPARALYDARRLRAVPAVRGLHRQPVQHLHDARAGVITAAVAGVPRSGRGSRQQVGRIPPRWSSGEDPAQIGGSGCGARTRVSEVALKICGQLGQMR